MPDDSTAALHRLARHIHADRHDPLALGPVLTERLSLSLLDLLGCHLAAAGLGVNNPIVAVAAGDPTRAPATLWLNRQAAEPALAALVNGTIAHHAEFDGGWHGPPRVGSHPAITILPAAVAMAQAVGASGRAFVAAAAAGYDTLAALACSLSPAAVGFRLHPPGLLGAFGAAAASARLLGRRVDETARALAICGGITPLCPFESFTAGASAKDCYGGWPAAIGVIAAQADAADDQPFTLPRLLGQPALNDDAIASALHEPALTHADFKAYPTCRTIHPALTALEALLARRPIAFDEVVAMDVETYAYAVELDAVAAPAWPIGARTSVLMCLALRLRDGPLLPSRFTRANLASPALAGLCARSTIAVGRYADSRTRGATLRLRLRDGQTIEHAVAHEKWSSAAPACPADVIAKFRTLAEPQLPGSDIDELLERVLNLGQQPSLDFIGTILGRATAAPQASAGPSGPAHDGAGHELARERGQWLRGMTERGANPATLTAAFEAVAQHASTLDPAAALRADTLALALAPAAAGPVPAHWPAWFGRQIAILARTGFSGPPKVLSGPRGLQHLITAGGTGLPGR